MLRRAVVVVSAVAALAGCSSDGATGPSDGRKQTANTPPPATPANWPSAAFAGTWAFTETTHPYFTAADSAGDGIEYDYVCTVSGTATITAKDSLTFTGTTTGNVASCVSGQPYWETTFPDGTVSGDARFADDGQSDWVLTAGPDWSCPSRAFPLVPGDTLAADDYCTHPALPLPTIPDGYFPTLPGFGQYGPGGHTTLTLLHR